MTALMTNPAGKDYYPFPSKVFALLYLLVHSPQRIVWYCFPKMYLENMKAE